VGPILLGADKPVHILTQTATVRGILNMTALAAVDATQTNTRAMTKLAAE
jgi:malate dehydrogenase (oxaloacetate-decarboxylating)(NADP+)